MKTILIADGHRMVAEGLKLLIESKNSEYKVRITLPSLVIAEMEKRFPDVVLLEISSASGGGFEILKNLITRFPKAKVLVLTAYKPDWHAKYTFTAGARGYLVKSETSEVLFVAIQTIVNGERYANKEVFQRALADWNGNPQTETSPIQRLSSRELQVFELIGRGSSAVQVGETLHLALKTVEAHLEHIKKKLGLKRRIELVVYAAQWVQYL